MFDPYARLAGVYDELVVDPCFALWADFAEGAWADDPRPVRTILDVCCGTGLMTVELARRGFAMTGIDASAAMLALAGVRLSPASTLVEARLPDLPDSPVLAGPFDAMVSTFDGLNYLDPADLRLALTRLVPRLRHGGWFVFDVHAEPMLDYVRDNPVILGEHDGASYAVTYVVDEASRTCRSIMRLEDDADPDASFTEEHRQFLHSSDTIRAVLVDAGLEVVSVTDEYTQVPVGPDTLRATWVARRPA